MFSSGLNCHRRCTVYDHAVAEIALRSATTVLHPLYHGCASLTPLPTPHPWPSRCQGTRSAAMVDPRPRAPL